jgi:Flp pilus assembly protein TadB
MTNVTLAALGTFEWVIIAMVAVLKVGVPVATLVILWLWQRRRAAPSTRASESDTHRGV